MLLVLSKVNPVFAQTIDQCKGSLTFLNCHYQTTANLSCGVSNPDPFRWCTCQINSAGQCVKATNANWCSTQSVCNQALRNVNLSGCGVVFGDCCGCSGKPKVIFPVATPTVKPSPAPVAGCFQSCVSNLDCSGGLTCGYNVVAGRRVCSNGLCQKEPTCRCSWQ